MLLLLWRKTSLRNFFFLFNLLKKLLVRRSRLEKIAASWLLALYLDLFKPKENKSQHWTFFYCCELHALVTAAWITNTVRVHSRSFHYFQFDIFLCPLCHNLVLLLLLFTELLCRLHYYYGSTYNYRFFPHCISLMGGESQRDRPSRRNP